jgi:RNA polymerase sigma factor (TIGR02999 family)
MRQILINHARDKRAAKRAGKFADLSLDVIETPNGTSALDLVALDDALKKLEALNERHARIVELRFLASATVEEVAHVMGMSTRTVEREWRQIRAWLTRELGAGEA